MSFFHLTHPYRAMLLKIDFPEIELKMAEKWPFICKLIEGKLLNISRLKIISNNKQGLLKGYVLS